ncbi:MAG: transpeptidase family protein [Acidobacteria bacterium]|nr:transpeptidase family protein [Acidobacteriota bacterium]
MPGSRNPVSRRHLWILPALLGLWAVVIVTRLIHLQVFQSSFFQRQARRQQERTIEVSPVRGVLYDRNLRPLAISVEVESVFAVPGEIRNPEATAKLLAPVLEMEARVIRQRLRGPRYFSWVKRKVSARQAARVRQLNLQGVYFQKENQRFYPKAELAAHVLGHVGVDDQGLAGMELRYEEVLRGRPGQLLIERDAHQRWLRRTGRPPRPGQNLVLTLDENIQHIAERELAAAFQQSRAISGTVVVQDPHTGEILALANQPTFNPNRYAGADSEALRNLAVSAAYEPGSAFKVVTVAAALEEKLAEPQERIDCQMGSIVLAGRRIRDHKPFGILSVEQIIQNSSNVGAIQLALRLGNESFYQYVRSFGFGSPTGIELPGEAMGLTKPPERWSKISIGAMAMGQEIGVTPLQIAAMASIVANGGWWVRPRIVRSDPAGRIAEPPLLADRRRIISPETAEMLQRMMTLVVEKGTGRQAKPQGYTAAGKTGTSQKIDPATRAYSRRDHVASFVGFAPAESPVFTILVVLDSPRGRYHGGDASAPVFRKIAEQVLAYRNVPASGPAKPPLALASLKEMPLDPLAEPIGAMELTTMVPVNSNVMVPNFLGKPLRVVTEQSQNEGLEVVVIGSGVASQQWPPPGSPLPEGEKIRVWFQLGLGGNRSSPQPVRPPASPPKAEPVRSGAPRPLPATG